MVFDNFVHQLPGMLFCRVSGFMTLAVGFNPRNVIQNFFAASAATESNANVSRHYATQNQIQLDRGLKPTSKFI